MKILIIEDERPSADRLIKLINQYDETYEIVSVIESVQKGVKWFSDNDQPDLVFSDIKLLNDNVFSLFKKVKISCPVIFITAYDDYLLQAFETNGIAYVIKPYVYEQLEASIKKYKTLNSIYTHNLLQKLGEVFNQNMSYRQRFTIKIGGVIYILKVSNIVFISTENSMCIAHDNAGKKYPLVENLQELEMVLDRDTFFRINRSEIVNIHFIEKIQSHVNDSLNIQFKGLDIILTSSISRTASFRKWLNR